MATMSSTSSSVGSGSPCGACKFLRRKCATDCVFAPYFCSEQGPARFAAIHKVFGASNVSKLLLHVPVHDRCEAVVTIAYEAQARIRDPVYGCVSHIFALQQQVASLQAQLMQVKAQLMANNNIVDSRSLENNWMGINIGGAGGGGGFHQQNLSYQTNNYMNNNNSSVSPQSSLDSSVDNNSSNDIGGGVQENRDEDDHHHQYYSPFQPCSKKRLVSNTDLSELQALAFRMMRN